MQSKRDKWMAFWAVFSAMNLWAGYAIGIYVMRCDWQKGAVKAGVAEWVASKSGSPEFRWKTSAAQSAEGE